MLSKFISSRIHSLLLSLLVVFKVHRRNQSSPQSNKEVKTMRIENFTNRLCVFSVIVVDMSASDCRLPFTRKKPLFLSLLHSTVLCQSTFFLYISFASTSPIIGNSSTGNAAALVVNRFWKCSFLRERHFLWRAVSLMRFHRFISSTLRIDIVQSLKHNFKMNLSCSAELYRRLSFPSYMIISLSKRQKAIVKYEFA